MAGRKLIYGVLVSGFAICCAVSSAARAESGNELDCKTARPVHELIEGSAAHEAPPGRGADTGTAVKRLAVEPVGPPAEGSPLPRPPGNTGGAGGAVSN